MHVVESNYNNIITYVHLRQNMTNNNNNNDIIIIKMTDGTMIDKSVLIDVF